PGDRPPLIVISQRPDQVPPIDAVRSPETILALEKFGFVSGLFPSIEISGEIFRMDRFLPSPAFALLKDQTGIREPLVVEKINPAVRTCDPDDLGDRICKIPEAF